MRTLVADTLDPAGLAAVDALDSWSALMLAQQLDLPLRTAGDEITDERGEIIRPW